MERDWNFIYFKHFPKKKKTIKNFCHFKILNESENYWTDVLIGAII